MKNIFILLLVISFTSCLDESKEGKAKNLIKKHLKETLNDYDNYSAVSYSAVDSLFTKWTLPEELRPTVKELAQCAESINQSGYKNITITSDANSFLKDFEKLYDEKYRKNKSIDFLKKEEKWKQLWTEFKHHQDIIEESKKNFKPKFIGWKMTHKYRAKNQYDATILQNRQFSFNEDITQVTGVEVLNVD